MGLTLLTDAEIAVDASRDTMWSVSEIADRDGISKQAVSKRVRDLAERHELLVERNAQGHVTAVDVAHYDLLRERYGDPSQVRQPRPSVPAGELPLALPQRDTIEEANRRRALIAARKGDLELAQITKRLLRADMVQAAVGKCGDAIVREVGRLSQDADAIALAAKSDEVHAIRRELVRASERMQARIAKALAELQGAAPADDEDLPAELEAIDDEGEGD